MERGVRLGVDVGSVRIGIARTDIDGSLAVPVETVARGAADVQAVAALVCEYEAVAVVVGHPVSLDGSIGPAAQIAVDFAHELAAIVDPVPVRLVDERMSTATAHRQFRELGKTTRQTRQVVDQAAAVVILELALDAERRTGKPLGLTVGNT